MSEIVNSPQPPRRGASLPPKTTPLKRQKQRLNGPPLEGGEIEGYVWRSNRHMCCSWLAMAAASIKEIQELAELKTITMSARYSHLSPEHRPPVIDRIASAR